MLNSHTVRLTADGSIFHDLEIDQVDEGLRDKFRILQSEGGILFRTPAGKKWFMKFSEFSFVINERKPAKAVETAA